MKIFVLIVMFLLLSTGYSNLKKDHRFYLEKSSSSEKVFSKCEEPEKYGDVVTINLSNDIIARLHVEVSFRGFSLTGPPIFPLFPTFGDSAQDKRFLVRISFNKPFTEKPILIMSANGKSLKEDNKRYEHLEKSSSDFFKFVFIDNNKKLSDSVTLEFGLDKENTHKLKLVKESHWNYSPFIYVHEESEWLHHTIPPC